MGHWPTYLLERAGLPPSEGCGVVAGTTPVVSFGDPLAARVATLGINPSSGEFLDSDGTLLAGERRRLATLQSLGVVDYDAIDHAVAVQILDDCATYFERRPYRWFTPLDRILRAALDVSYFDRTACHLDLVQWATDPLWGQLDDTARARLLAADRAFLIRQLRSEQYQVVVVNGRTAMEWLERARVVRWRRVGQLAGPPTAGLFVGQSDGPLLLGWSCNLQSQAGAARHAAALVEFVAKYGLPAARGADFSLDFADAIPPLVSQRPTDQPPRSLRPLTLTMASGDTVGHSAAIVQFPHPGVEHVPPGEVMEWNAADHRRKFLTRPGRRLRPDGTIEAEEELAFWGEWEAPSRIVERWPRAEGLPTVLHDPYWRRPPAGFRQNTDPWVFGKRFLYSNCKQLTPTKGPSALQQLPVGSLILFGSVRHDHFVLDTLLVVAGVVGTFVPVETDLVMSDAFTICTLDSLTTCDPAVAGATFTLYRGATPDKPIAGMFSFVPCRPRRSSNARFSRPQIELPTIINPLSRQSPSGAKQLRPLAEVTTAWAAVVDRVMAAGLYLGGAFELPPYIDQFPIETIRTPSPLPAKVDSSLATPPSSQETPRPTERRCAHCFQLRRTTQFGGDSTVCIDCN